MEDHPIVAKYSNDLFVRMFVRLTDPEQRHLAQQREKRTVRMAMKRTDAGL